MKSSTISVFFFWNVPFSRENQQPVLGSHRITDEKGHFSLDVKQKHTFDRTKINDFFFFLPRSAPLTNMIL